MRRLSHLCLVALILAPLLCAARDSGANRAVAPEIAARVETTLATDGDQIRQLAFDGDPGTCFASAGNVQRGDHFTLVFDQSVALAFARVLTGRGDGSARLESGSLQVSEDGTTFEEFARFEGGTVEAADKGLLARALRIQPTADQAHPLAIREITIESTPAVAVFRYPVEFTVDTADAPEMNEWAEKTATACERAYPMINDELKSDGFRPPRRVTLSLKTTYRGVAATGGDHITGSVGYFKAHPDDVGAMIHETVHVVQHYRSRGNPGWLVEGVADYVRFFKYEPGKLGRINPERAHYDGSYRVTAAFIAYLTVKYDRDLIRKLNQMMREGNYQEDAFRQLTGKTVQELDEEWRGTLS